MRHSKRLKDILRPPNRLIHRRVCAAFVGIAAGAAFVQMGRTKKVRRRIVWKVGAGSSHDGALYARNLGVGTAGVVLLHGLGASSEYWGAGYDTLAETGRLVVPDLLGFGRSPRPPSGYTVADHVDALVSVLDELGLTGPIVVGAHSFGCQVALALAQRCPDRVAAVVGFCPPLYPDEASARKLIGGLGWLEHQLANNEPWAEITCNLVCKNRGTAAAIASLIRPGLPAAIRRDGVQHSWASYSGSFREISAATLSRRWLANIRVPVQLVAGSEDPITDLVYLRELAGLLPYVALSICDGADHNLPLTHPADAVAVITRVAEVLSSSRAAGDPKPDSVADTDDDTVGPGHDRSMSQSSVDMEFPQDQR
jgi:pimeloyl-ACP methyl ester carboxylesterase